MRGDTDLSKAKRNDSDDDEQQIDMDRYKAMDIKIEEYDDDVKSGNRNDYDELVINEDSSQSQHPSSGRRRRQRRRVSPAENERLFLLNRFREKNIIVLFFFLILATIVVYFFRAIATTTTSFSSTPQYANTYISTHFANVDEIYNNTDLPVFWHIPKSGGTTVYDLLVNCFSLTVASEVGIIGHESDTELEIVHESNRKYVNVDVTSPEGIQRAGEMGFVESSLADVALTPFINEMAELFDPPYKRGRCFTLIRHPIRRAVSMFYYRQIADWETSYRPEWQNMTLEDYASSDQVENNWMTRFLVGKTLDSGELSDTPLTSDDIQLSRDILGKKCLIGLLDHFEDSLLRFETYFGWNLLPNKQDRLACQKGVFNRGGDNVNPHPHITEGSDVWNQLAQSNRFDLELYYYALYLYEEQSKFFNKRI